METKIVNGAEIRRWKEGGAVTIRITKGNVSTQYIKVLGKKICDDIWQSKRIKKLTIIDATGDEYEFFNTGTKYGNSWDEDDIKKVKKGSIVAIRDDDKTATVVCGFSSDYLNKLNKKYFKD
jgi:hypothetical protein